MTPTPPVREGECVVQTESDADRMPWWCKSHDRMLTGCVQAKDAELAELREALVKCEDAMAYQLRYHRDETIVGMNHALEEARRALEKSSTPSQSARVPEAVPAEFIKEPRKGDSSGPLQGSATGLAAGKPRADPSTTEKEGG